MEKKGKYLLGLFCALALALGFMWPEAANAETTLPEEVAHTSHDGWTELTAETRILASGSKYYLKSDVVLNKQLICNSNVILCLNGYELTVKDVLKGGIKIPKGAALTICDCRPEAPQDVFKSPATGETVTVNGGRIRGSQCTDGIIYVDGGSLTIYGGSVVGNANRGINIVLGTFIMNGGAILHNKGGSGAGVQVSGGSFTMNGGIISNNESTGDGGGVQLTGLNPQLTLAGGTISNNTAMKNGGGVYVSPVSFSLSGDMVIKDNSATENGKNVYFFNINDDKAINIGQLKNTVPISIYIYNQIKFTNGWSASMGSADPARYFTSENTGYNILSDGVELYMTKHSHSWETSWQSADGYHWHNCSAEGCFITENIGKDGYGAHVGSDDGDCTTMLKCTTCDVEMIAAKEHSFGTSPSNKVATAATCTEVATYYVKCDNENCSQVSSAKTVSSGTVDPDAHKPAEDWTQEGDKHYHACENGCDAHLDEADCSGGTATCVAKAVCSVCSNEYGSVDANNHAWSTAWSSDDTHHWHACTREGCALQDKAQMDGYGAHSYDNAFDATCNTCGYKRAVSVPIVTPPSYDITLPSIDHGTITTDAKSARKGELVTITAVPDEGFALDTLTVTDQRGKTVALTDNDDESFSFIMPSGRITIEATFTEIVPEAPVVFVDAREGDWFYSDVVFVSERGLMVGVDENHFAPHELTSRAMLVTVLYRLEGEPTAERSGFSDVAEDAWYSGAVAWAEENGIVSGHTDGTFAPNAAMSREQMATMLYRYACVKGYDTSARADLSGYNDQDDISTYAQEALSWCKAVGIVGGVDETTLSPQSGAERAQVAAMLHRFIERFQA